MVRRAVAAAWLSGCLAGACAHDYTRWKPQAIGRNADADDTRAQYAALRIQGSSGGAGPVPPDRECEAQAGSAGDATALQRTAAANALRLDAMFGEERDVIARSGRDSRVGLALSGGGIRSAAFSLGVLQGLHETGILERVGYLSTVSGGGFAAAWYLTHGTADALFAPGSEHLRHVAQNGIYLSSRHASRSAFDMAQKGLGHVLRWPLAALLDEVFHLQQNVVGLRTYYRDGIRRAFLYDNPFDTERWLGLRLVDPGPFERPGTLASYLPSQGHSVPYWIVNCHIILNHDGDGEFKNRSGGPFEITPLRAGGDSVGYVRVPGPSSTSRDQYWMDPAYAVAISGAAADSQSMQLGAKQSLALYLSNADLGYFIKGFAPGWVKGDPSSDVLLKNLAYAVASPIFVNRLLSLITPAAIDPAETHRFRRDAKMFGLTDGGHFENLGVYALVKRGCRVIIASDSSMDPLADQWDSGDRGRRARAFADVRRLEALLEADFGARLQIEWESFSPSPCGSVAFTDLPPQAVFLGCIRNLPVGAGSGPGDDEVTIVFVKSASAASGALRRGGSYVDIEQAEDPPFPNESTRFQYYSERKMLAHIRLGRDLVLANARRIREPIDGLGPAPTVRAER